MAFIVIVFCRVKEAWSRSYRLKSSVAKAFEKSVEIKDVSYYDTHNNEKCQV